MVHCTACFALFIIITQVVANSPLELIAETNAKFSRDYFKALNDRRGNLVTSPLSAQLALAMTQLGAGGNTASVMSSALHLPQDRTTSNEGFKQLTNVLQGENSDGISLKVANRIYLQNNFPVQQEFVREVSETFDSEPQSVDFGNPATRTTINQWVEQVTQNKIKDLIEEGALTADTRVVLVNAVYFLGKWTKRFNPQFTYNRTFHIGESETINVTFMSQKRTFKNAYLANLQSKIVILPYEGDKMSLVILLPDSRTGLSKLEKEMETQDLGALINSSSLTVIKLIMPKFKIETTIDLKEPLTKMGMGEMFQNSADFSKITSEERLKISKAVQKTIIQVTESGTEAASATYTSRTSYSRTSPPPKIIIDHPFLFYIVHHTSIAHNVVLFAGRVMQPRGFTS